MTIKKKKYTHKLRFLHSSSDFKMKNYCQVYLFKNSCDN